MHSAEIIEEGWQYGRDMLRKIEEATGKIMRKSREERRETERELLRIAPQVLTNVRSEMYILSIYIIIKAYINQSVLFIKWLNS
jgi:hypothetical protein